MFYSLDDYTQLDPIEVVTILTTAMKGRGIDMADKHGRTPLHFAAYRGATISFTHLIEVSLNFPDVFLSS